MTLQAAPTPGAVRPFFDPVPVGHSLRRPDGADSAGNTAHPFGALLAPVAAPEWHGRASVYRLLDAPTPKPVDPPRRGRPRGSCNKAKPRRWVPWALITPRLEAEVAAGKWDMSNLWPFPAKDVA